MSPSASTNAWISLTTEAALKPWPTERAARLASTLARFRRAFSPGRSLPFAPGVAKLVLRSLLELLVPGVAPARQEVLVMVTLSQ